jgi:hypothetical protein
MTTTPPRALAAEPAITTAPDVLMLSTGRSLSPQQVHAHRARERPCAHSRLERPEKIDSGPFKPPERE